MPYARLIAFGSIMCAVTPLTAGRAAAANVCAQYFDGLRAANTLLYAASRDAHNHNAAEARSEFNRAAAMVRTTRPGISDTRCDPPNYLYTKFAVEIHEIATSTDVSPADAIVAYNAMLKLYQHFFGAPAPSAESSMEWYYVSRYPTTAGDIERYVKSIDDRFAAQEQTLHDPAGPQCMSPNLRPLAIHPATIWPPPFGMPAGTYLAVVDVNLDADGKVQSTRLSRSSGNAGIDADAERAAQLSTYVPAVRGCKRAASVFKFDRTYVIGATPR